MTQNQPYAHEYEEQHAPYAFVEELMTHNAWSTPDAQTQQFYPFFFFTFPFPRPFPFFTAPFFPYRRPYRRYRYW
ncbi:hypothetical protein [Laceyella tengchongensis]